MAERKSGYRPIKLTKAKMDLFLEYLREEPNVSRAAKMCGFTGAGAFYIKRKEDEDFKQAWDDALAEGVSVLESNLWKRANDKSDILGMFLLKAHKPDMYMERKDITSGGKPLDANPVTIVEVVLPAGSSPSGQLPEPEVEHSDVELESEVDQSYPPEGTFGEDEGE